MTMPRIIEREYERVSDNPDALRELGQYAILGEWNPDEEGWYPDDFLGDDFVPLNPNLDPPGEGQNSLELPQYAGEKLVAMALAA
jgi:hypothetical protein